MDPRVCVLAWPEHWHHINEQSINGTSLAGCYNSGRAGGLKFCLWCNTCITGRIWLFRTKKKSSSFGDFCDKGGKSSLALCCIFMSPYPSVSFFTLCGFFAPPPPPSTFVKGRVAFEYSCLTSTFNWELCGAALWSQCSPVKRRFPYSSPSEWSTLRVLLSSSGLCPLLRIQDDKKLRTKEVNISDWIWIYGQRTFYSRSSGLWETIWALSVLSLCFLPL